MKLLFPALMLCACSLLAGGDPAASLFRQPTAKEIERVIASINKDQRKPDTMELVSAELKEPPKALLLNNPSGLVREIRVVVRDPRARRLHHINANAETGAITEWMRVDGELASLHANDALQAERLIRSHRGWNAGLARRGLDSSAVMISIWPSGIPKSSFNSRIVKCITWAVSKGNHRFDRPVEGLICTVNLDQNRVIEFYDRDIAPVAAPASWPKPPTSSRSSPPSSIKVNGNTVSWQHWMFDATLREREGLAITRLRWTDGTTTQSVAHSIALSEIAMVNADTSTYWYWRNALIVGEFGMGRNASPLVLGVDVPPNSRLFDAAIIGSNGTVRTVKGAIGIFERGSDLIITQHSTINNFLYRFSVILHNDGSVTTDLGVGGTPFVKGAVDTIVRSVSATGQSTGRLVAKNIVAPFLQHFVNVRCDLDVNGPVNVVSEVEYAKPLTEVDTYRNAVTFDDYELRFEREAMRTTKPTARRRWRISSAGHQSYVLLPQEQLTPIVEPPHMMLLRAPFISTPFLCTAYDPAQRYASGDYPLQSTGEMNIKSYVADNASIFHKDVVMWYTMGMFTTPRPEDWPVMKMQHVSFTLVPDGFVQSVPR